ncbi:MAG: hypothetical protein HN644_05205 [Rhodospirillales bacterium]|jgi:hypothetical protein|nr:hypothetical protein [Rhodospirillales bacterium]MBT4040948.1 hypothetical protein [Rhodospirillales bacterium]MBT4625650.1 hypothetical protein [Rhodospirillales bacterium]MBT5350181.1 hypothetical protein [Rhodospirillales bacterium]MBT5522037.1 hypothetical protein [Rhodospirillales bacterium]
MMRDIMGLYTPLLSNFLRPRTIRRIDDGRKVERTLHNDLKSLPEHTLKDMGFYSA